MVSTPSDIKLTVNKFIFKFPSGLRYSDSGLWVKPEEGLVRIGMSDFAQQRNGDIAFANFPDPGSFLKAGDEIASIETVKVNISLPSPLNGRIEKTNSLLEESPELINQDPYGNGWIVILTADEPEEIRRLLDAGAYARIVEQQAETELKA